MAESLRRWRGAFLAGVGVWLLSFPLLTAHPTPAVPVMARVSAIAGGAVTDDLVQGRPAWAHRVLELGELALQPASAPQAPAATVSAAQGSGPAPAAIPGIGANRIVIPRLGLSQPVGWYGDCLGRAAVPRWGAWRWSCAGANNTYVMAHNPGTFTPILSLRPGDLIEYGDPRGVVHTYRVSYTTIVSNTQLWPLSGTAAPSLTLQTCWTWDGSRDFIVRAIQSS